MSARWRDRLIGGVLVVPALLIVLLFVVITLNLHNGERTTGQVVWVDDPQDCGYPDCLVDYRVSFRTGDGSPVTAELYTEGPIEEGQVVEILYDRADPTMADLPSELWVWWLVVVVVAVVCSPLFVAGGWFLRRSFAPAADADVPTDARPPDAGGWTSRVRGAWDAPRES